MSILRGLFSIGEAGIRSRQIQKRIILSQENNLPMYVKQKGDGFTFGVAMALAAASFGCTVKLIKDFYKPAE